MRPWRYQYRLRRLLSLWGPLVAIGVLSLGAAFFVWRHIALTEPIEKRFARARNSGESDVAERLAWQMVSRQPSDPAAWLRFIDAHADVRDEGMEGGDSVALAVSERDIRAALSKITHRPAFAVVAYWYRERVASIQPAPREDSLAAEVKRLADANPPAPFANYVLARASLGEKQWQAAALRFEREGFAFPPEAERSLRRALAIWASHDGWSEIARRIDDPRYAVAVDAGLRLDLAIRNGNWPGILLWSWPASFVRVESWPLVLALVAASLWFLIATRLGRIHDGVEGRARLYVSAFLLGVVSIYPTILTIIVEESVFNLREMGEFVPDLIYFTFGVGLREEAWKTILFLPLLPALLRRGSRIEAMTCGALVGLGFAAEENVSYFHDYGAAAALARFLTANFLHMSLTALVALAVFDTRRGRAGDDGFSVVFPLAVAIHGAYDFLLTTDAMPLSSFLAMFVFIIIAQRFLRQLLIASSKQEERGILNLLVASMALLTGLSYVYATTLAGPWQAFQMIAVGTIGVAIVIYMFVRELSGA